MTILDDEESLPARGTTYNPSSSRSTRSLSPFPPRSFNTHHYQPTASSDQAALLPYAFQHSPTAFDRYPAEGGGGGAGTGSFSWLGWSRQRGIKMKLLVVLAGASIIFLLHDHFFRRRGGPHHGGPPPWARPPFGVPHPPDGDRLDEFGQPLPHADPQQTTTTSLADTTSTAAQTTSTDLPILDPAQFVQPRRAIRPAWPDPWHDLPRSWAGRAYLSEERFPGDGQGMSDPPERLPPPARYLSKAFEFAAAVARQLTTSTRVVNARQQPLPQFDERTGRPKQVPHEDVFIHQGGWKGPSLKVAEIKGGKMPKVQWEGKLAGGPDGERAVEESRRREWVKRAFLHAWEGYKKHAWGHDELMPLSNLFSNNYNGWGATIVDNLDTLLIMNLSHEYNLAREHVSQIDFSYLAPSGALTFSTDLPPLESLELPESVPLEPLVGAARFANPRFAAAMNQHSPTTLPHFETTIRYLGGMLSAYDLSGDPLMLQRAVELGDWLLPSLGTMYGLAINRYTLGSNPAGMNTGRAVLSEVGSLTLEFTRLSMLTGDEIYFQAVQRSMDTLDQLFPAAVPSAESRNRGRLGTLLPAWLDPSHPEIMSGEYTFGGLADSYYEYLIKQAQLIGDAHPQYSRMYSEAIDSAYQHLIQRIDVVPGRDDLATIGLAQWGMYSATLEHLTCFAGGMLGLGGRLLGREEDLQTGTNVTEACAWAYESTETGLGPESLVFYSNDESARYIVVETDDGPARQPRGQPVLGVKHSNAKFIGRPETIESVFYQWRLTGDRKWQDRGWQMFTSWMEHAITESGFASLNNVNFNEPKRQDSMESFVLAETLKYYYLLFSPRDLISLDDFVFNTEAHPFLIPKSPPSPPPSLWTGPDATATPTSSFVSSMGEGTSVQLWARVQQAAGLLHPSSKPAMGNAAPIFNEGEEKPPAVRKPIRPSEEELNRARKAGGVEVVAGAGAVEKGEKDEESVGKALEKHKLEEAKKLFAKMGGGRGMGGGGR